MRAGLRIVVDAEIGIRLVGHVGSVGQHHDLVELQSEVEQVFYLLVIDAGRIGRDPGVEELDPVVALLPRALQQPGEGILIAHADALGEGVADQQDAARRRFQRDGPGRRVLEAEAVGDQPVAHLAPDIVAVETGGQPVVIDGIGDPGRTLAFLAHSEARPGKIERQKQRQAIGRDARVNQRPAQAEPG